MSMVESGGLIYERKAGDLAPAPAAPGHATAPAAAARLPGRWQVDIHEDLAALEKEWRSLAVAARMTPFQSFDWLAAFQHNIGHGAGVRPALAVGRRPGGETLFILPLAVVRRGPLRLLTWLGAEVNDYNAPILGPGFAEAAGTEPFPLLWRTIEQAILAHPRLRFDFVHLGKMPETLDGQANPFCALPVTVNASRAHAVGLAPTWEAFYGRRSAATRSRDRTKLRRLAAFGAVAYAEPAGEAETRGFVDTLVALKSQQLERMGARNLFGERGYRAFLLDLATGESTRELVHVSGLRVGGTLAAVNLGLRFRRCYYHIFMSYELGEMSRFGPGAAHLRELFRHAIEAGMETFDFTIGDEPYKEEWCDRELTLFDHLSAVDARGALAATAVAGYLRAKRLIKNSPRAWRLYSRARSAVGRLRKPARPADPV